MKYATFRYDTVEVENGLRTPFSLATKAQAKVKDKTKKHNEVCYISIVTSTIVRASAMIEQEQI